MARPAFLPGHSGGSFAVATRPDGRQSTTPDRFTNADGKAGTSRTPDGYIVEFEVPLTLIDTQHGPESVSAARGSEPRVNFGIHDAQGFEPSFHNNSHRDMRIGSTSESRFLEARRMLNSDRCDEIGDGF